MNLVQFNPALICHCAKLKMGFTSTWHKQIHQRRPLSAATKYHVVKDAFRLKYLSTSLELEDFKGLFLRMAVIM